MLRTPAMPISFSISDTYSIIAALVIGPAAGAVTAAVDGLVLSCQMPKTRRAPHRVLFNMASPAIATWAAAQIFFTLAGPHPLTHSAAGALRLLALLTLFGAIDFGLNTVTVATAISLQRRVGVLAVWKEHFTSLWITYCGGVFAAMLMMAISQISTIEGLILLAPLPVILYVAFRHAQGRAQDQIQHLGKMNKVYVAAIEALAHAVDTKDQVTHDHVRRVEKNALQLARSLGVTDDLEIQAIKAASLLHDVGKIGVPEHILNKPGKLTGSEFEIMKQHAPMGAEILSVIGFPYPVVPIVRHHHENWDGSGYPDGLSGEAIPIGARVLAVVDCFDALTSDRPYRPKLSDRDALKIVADRRGNMYDPRVVDVFFAQYEAEIAQISMDGTFGAGLTAGPRLSDHLPMEDAGAPVALRAFYDLGMALPRAASPHDLGQALWTHLAEQLPASSFVLFAYEAKTDALVPVFRSDARVVAATTHIAVGERLSGWVAATGQAIVNSDARLDVDESLRHESALHSALAVPANAGGRAVGVLAFYSEQTAPFTDGHCRLAVAAASIIADTEIATAARVAA
jgi:putative nucleotidyltransferase with HDIG domain